MTGNTGKTEERQNRSRYFLWLRTLLGLCILGFIVVWVMNKGTLFERLNTRVLVFSILISMFTSMLHAATLCSIAHAYKRKLDYRFALTISALGTLGNTLGGLPLGTTLKYAILYKRVGLKIGQIMFGLMGYTFVISLMLLAYATVSAMALDFRFDIKAMPGLLLFVGIIVLIISANWAQKSTFTSNLINPFLRWPTLAVVTALGFSLASLFIINPSVVAHGLFPEHPLIHVVFLSAAGIFISLVSLLQSVAGIQEVTMGFSAFLSGIEAIDGVQIALVIRFTAIIASGMILCISYLLSGGKPEIRRLY